MNVYLVWSSLMICSYRRKHLLYSVNDGRNQVLCFILLDRTGINTLGSCWTEEITQISPKTSRFPKAQDVQNKWSFYRCRYFHPGWLKRRFVFCRTRNFILSIYCQIWTFTDQTHDERENIQRSIQVSTINDHKPNYWMPWHYAGSVLLSPVPGGMPTAHISLIKHTWFSSFTYYRPEMHESDTVETQNVYS